MTAAYDGELRSPGSDRRSLPVPDGLDGMRLDQAVSRLFGLSRTAAANHGSCVVRSMTATIAVAAVTAGPPK